MSRHLKTPTRSSSSVIRRILGTAAVFAAAAVVAVAGAGTSYALWSGRTAVDAATVQSGSTQILVDGGSSATLAGLDASALGPGQSAVASVLLENTGTTNVAVTVDGTVVTGTNGLEDELTLILTPVWSSADCHAGMTRGASDRLTHFTTASYPVVFPMHQRVTICMELKLDSDAPASVQNGTASFIVNLTGQQVR